MSSELLKPLKLQNTASWGWWLLGFVSFYLGFVFPFSFFRHDDWLILGNVARFLPNNWQFLFEPHLKVNSIKQIWFFRPWFKLIVYFYHSLFGFHYFAWLCLNLLFTVGALIFGFLSIRLLSLSADQGILFLAFFIFSLHFHFGSLVWAGEGSMNCPQVFFLFFNLYFFSRAIRTSYKQQAYLFHFLALLTFIFSLGFKESSLFHLPFVFLILFHSQNDLLNHKNKVLIFLPYILIATLYFIFRLYVIPFNPGYIPTITTRLILYPTLFLLGSLLLPYLALLFAAFFRDSGLEKPFKITLSFLWYLLFFAPFFAVYMGHGFFSPGWLLTPGMYVAYIIGLKFPLPFFSRKMIRIALLCTLIVSGASVIYQAHQLKWWMWHRPQRQLLKIIEEKGSHSTQTLQIFDCNNVSENLPSFNRVVGNRWAIQEMFWLKHKTMTRVRILPCQALEKETFFAKPETLSLKWSFPDFSIVSP